MVGWTLLVPAIHWPAWGANLWCRRWVGGVRALVDGLCSITSICGCINTL